MAKKRRDPRGIKHVTHRPRGNFQGQRISDLQREMTVQAYVLTGNKSEVARQMGISYPTVCKIIKEMELSPEMQKIRAGAMEELAGKVHKKTDEILDSIIPEDLESGLIKTHGEDGELKSVRAYGPSLMQKTTAAAIFMDKMRVIQDTKAILTQDGAANPMALPAPDSVQAALKAIGEKVKSLRIVDVQFAEKAPELASKLQDLATSAALQNEATDAEYEELDFDN